MVESVLKESVATPPTKPEALANASVQSHETSTLESSALDSRAIYLVWLALWVLIAFWLRTYRLDLQSLWYDEGVTVDIARRTLPDLTRWTAQDIQPPLYYYVVSAWGKLLQGIGPQPIQINEASPKLWGGAWSEWSIRFVSVFFGLLTVPLMASLATQLTKRRLAGAIAGMLAALHPLLFYYSQEARMYAMLTFLGMLAGYILFGGFGNGKDSAESGDGTRWWIFILVATAAVYTHYFAFFLLAALGLGYLLSPPRNANVDLLPNSENNGKDANKNRFRSRLGALVSAGITILILYTPWFVALFSQLSGDSSYWEGEFKLSEALTKIAISFAGGETVTETVGLWLLLPIGIVTLACVLALILPSRLSRTSQQPVTNNKRLPIYLLWWLLPAALILLLALLIPKFNPRYVMIALPGLILLWSAGLSEMLIHSWAEVDQTSASSDRQSSTQTTTSMGQAVRILAIALMIVILAIFMYADRNYFADPEFTKTQWSPLARYVEKRIPPEDVVILTSGHTWPIWNYYAPHIPAVSVPQLRILDVNSVVDYPTATSLLGNALINRNGAWLVSWQDEVVDPMDVVPLILERAGDEVPSERDYWDISLRRFENLDSTQLGIELGSPTAVNYGSQLVLRGFDIHNNGELLLFWQRHPEYMPPQSNLDLRITGQLQTPDGLAYHFFDDQPLTSDEWPTTQWQPEQLVVSRVPADVWAGAGAMPGAYGLRLGLYDPAGDLGGYDILNDSGQPVGKQRTLPIQLASFTTGAIVQPADMDVTLSPALSASINIPENAIEPGQSLPIEIEWIATEGIDLDDLAEEAAIRFSWQNQSGESVAQQEMAIAPGHPISSWLTGQKLRSLHRLHTDADLLPGQYSLVVSIANQVNSRESAVAAIEILPTTRIFEVPKLGQPIEVEFGGEIALRGLINAPKLPSNAQEAETISFTLVWQAIATPQRDYSVSIQLLDANNVPSSQVDLQLPGSPTTWLSEQVVEQVVDLTIPSGITNGQLIAAVYDSTADGFPRLLRQDGTDFVIIANVGP